MIFLKTRPQPVCKWTGFCFMLCENISKQLCNKFYFTSYIEAEQNESEDFSKKETITMLKDNVKLNLNELSQIAGGTVKECEELLDAYGGPDALGFWGPCGYFGNYNQTYARALEKALKKDFNVDAYISVGFGGTGFHAVNNTYSINGKSLSHKEVLDMIKAA